MDEAREYQQVTVTYLTGGKCFISFVAPQGTAEVARICSDAWHQPDGWCLNVLVALGIDAVREKQLWRDPMPWIMKHTSDLKAEMDAEG